MPESGPLQWWIPGASGAAHLLLIVAVALIVFTRPAAIAPAPLPVEMITPEAFAAAMAGRAAERVPQTALEPVPVPGPAMTNATVFYAGQALLDPANREVRETLPTLARADRMVQLCSLEAIEQIRLARPATEPDAVAPYAFDDVAVNGATLDAPAGAFRSAGAWFGVSFSCTVAADLQSVTAFRFAVGDPIPEAEWAGHNLVRGGGAED